MANPPRRKPRSLADFDPRGDGPKSDVASTVGQTTYPAAPQEDEGVPVTYFVRESDRDRLKMLYIQKKLTGQQFHHLAVNHYLMSLGLQALEPQTSNRASGGRKKR